MLLFNYYLQLCRMKTSHIFFLLVSFFLLYSCDKNEPIPEEKEDYLEVLDKLSFSFREASEEITVRTSISDWTFSSCNDWIIVDSVRGKEDAIEIRVKTNYHAQRRGIVRIEAGDLIQDIDVIQHAMDDQLDLLPDFSPFDEVHSVGEASSVIAAYESAFGHKNFFRSEGGGYNPEEKYDFHLYTELQYERVKNKEINSHAHYIIHNHMREIDGVIEFLSVKISRFVFQPTELIPFHFDIVDGHYEIKNSTIEKLKERGYIFSEQDEEQKIWFFSSSTVEDVRLCIKMAALGTDSNMVVFGYGSTEELKKHIPKFK